VQEAKFEYDGGIELVPGVIRKWRDNVFGLFISV
jgi:hypothetical protein